MGSGKMKLNTVTAALVQSVEEGRMIIMNNDLIERQTAIEAWKNDFKGYINALDMPKDDYDGIMAYIDELPSAQPERLADDDFETIRIHLSAYKEELCNQHRWEEAEEYQRIIDRFMTFASEQPERPEPCEDAVSRQRLLNDLKELITAWEKYPVMAEQIKGVETAIKYVEMIPSVASKQELYDDAVSRESVSKWLKQYEQDVLHGKYKFSLMYIWKNLMDLPSARTEIVRCDKCKHGVHSGRGNVYICHISSELVMEHTGDFYCGYAERKDDE